MYSHYTTLALLPIFFFTKQVHSLSTPVPPRAQIKPNNKNTNPPPTISRREALITGTTTAVTTAAAILSPSPSHAEENTASLPIEGLQVVSGPPERQALLQAIASNAPEQTVVNLIAKLEPLDPSKGNGAAVPELDGTWELIYSVNAEAFSPLLNLPKPVRPTSLQLLGDDAAREVGGGRVAQVLNFPFAPLSFLLSSGAVPVEDKRDTLEIFPPFRFEVVWGDASLRKAGRLFAGETKAGGRRIKVVESGSDADFRALNARDGEAQAAGRNMYKQRYLEVTGQTGDLRISEVVDGDPVIVGAVFVHRRL